MADEKYTIPDNPQYKISDIRKLQDTDPASASQTFNPLVEALLELAAYLNKHKAGLDENGKVPENQLPEMDYVPTNEKGKPSGVATLGGDGKVPSDQLPDMNYDTAGAAAAVQQNLDAHTGNKNNPHGVTAAQLGAASAWHTHSASQITDLILGLGKSLEGQNAKIIGVSDSNKNVVSDTTAGEGAEIFNDYRARSYYNYGTYGVNQGNVASGKYSHSEGSRTTASGDYSHAEGGLDSAFFGPIASGTCSHAEGSGTFAGGGKSHAEGSETRARGNSSHSEGYGVVASGNSSHAEGSGDWNTTSSSQSGTASGNSSHSEGYCCNATESATHAEGWCSVAGNYASHSAGKYNKAMKDGGSYDNIVGDVLVIGNGTGYGSRTHSNTVLSNCFRVTFAGETYGLTSFKTSGADYAEYFEWQDGNPQAEDRVGRFVTMSGKHIKTAAPGDYILGVVSGQPCIIGNADEDWLGRWEHDDFGRFVKRYMVEDKTEIDPPADEEARMELLHDPQVREENGRWYRLTPRFVDYETPSWDYKPNPDYDSSQPYIERRDRKEWDAVGMLGVLPVWDDGSCQVDGWCQPGENGTATAAESYIPGQTYRVIERVSENVVKIVFR